MSGLDVRRQVRAMQLAECAASMERTLHTWGSADAVQTLPNERRRSHRTWGTLAIAGFRRFGNKTSTPAIFTSRSCNAQRADGRHFDLQGRLTS